MGQRNSSIKGKGISEAYGIRRDGSLRPKTDNTDSLESRLGMSPMWELDLLISQGYGDVSQLNLPADWRTVKFEDQPRRKRGNNSGVRSSDSGASVAAAEIS